MDTQVLNIYREQGRDAAVDFLTSVKGFSVEAANGYISRLEDVGHGEDMSSYSPEPRFSGDLEDDDEINELLDDEDFEE